MPKEITNRIELPLHYAVKLALSTVGLRQQNILHNLIYIVDKPGAGKTMCIGKEVTAKGWGFCPYSPALERLEKFGGIPDLFWVGDSENKHENELRTIWSVPQMISEINDAAKKYPYVVVLFDDWHLCDEDLQKIGFEVFTYYKLNNNPIGENVIFMLAGNESSAAGAKVQISAIRNRSTMIYSHADVKYWIGNFAIPHGIHPVGISFFNNPMNHDLLQEPESSNDQFGSPRSWTSLLNLITHVQTCDDLMVPDSDFKMSLPPELIHALAQGSVSRVATERFMMHFKIYSEIDLEEIFDKGKIDIPDDPVARYCYVTAATYEFYSRWCSEKLDTAKKYLNGIYAKLNGELRKRHRELASTSVVNLSNIPNNDRLNYPSGLQILTELIRHKALSPDDIQDLKKITTVLSMSSK